MSKDRILVISDGIIIMIATIMVFEFRAPRDVTIYGLAELIVPIMAYTLSFFLVIGDWFNYHRLIRSIKVVSARGFVLNILWLFIMSFFPLATSWVGRAPMAVEPALFYLAIEFLWNVSFHLLGRELAKENPDIDLPRLRYAFPGWYFYGLDFICLVLVWFWPPVVLVTLSIMALTELIQFWRSNEISLEES